MNCPIMGKGQFINTSTKRKLHFLMCGPTVQQEGTKHVIALNRNIIYIHFKSIMCAMTSHWSNQNPNPALKTKKKILKILRVHNFQGFKFFMYVAPTF